MSNTQINYQEITDKIKEAIDADGITHTLFRFKKMNSVLKSVIEELENRVKASVLDDIHNFMQRVIIESLENVQNQSQH